MVFPYLPFLTEFLIPGLQEDERDVGKLLGQHVDERDVGKLLGQHVDDYLGSMLKGNRIQRTTNQGPCTGSVLSLGNTVPEARDWSAERREVSNQISHNHLCPWQHASFKTKTLYFNSLVPRPSSLCPQKKIRRGIYGSRQVHFFGSPTASDFNLRQLASDLRQRRTSTSDSIGPPIASDFISDSVGLLSPTAS